MATATILHKLAFTVRPGQPSGCRPCFDKNRLVEGQYIYGLIAEPRTPHIRVSSIHCLSAVDWNSLHWACHLINTTTGFGWEMSWNSLALGW
jgi:hypothetical protein